MQLETQVLAERYRDPVQIGHGAMGDVYKARDALLDRDVAIKLLGERFAADPEIRARFEREGLAAARLSAEPGIVTIFDVGEADGRPFLVMELLPGGSIAQRLALDDSQKIQGHRIGIDAANQACGHGAKRH